MSPTEKYEGHMLRWPVTKIISNSNVLVETNNPLDMLLNFKVIMVPALWLLPGACNNLTNSKTLLINYFKTLRKRGWGFPKSISD